MDADAAAELFYGLVEAVIGLDCIELFCCTEKVFFVRFEVEAIGLDTFAVCGLSYFVIEEVSFGLITMSDF